MNPEEKKIPEWAHNTEIKDTRTIKRNELSVADFLNYTTVHITTISETGEEFYGTGFYFLIENPGDAPLLTLITNKHVIEGGATGELKVNTCDANGDPYLTKHMVIGIKNFERMWRPHPDPDVDLCILPVSRFFKKVKDHNVGTVFYQAFTERHFPTSKQIENLGPLEDIVMVGYPNNISDKVNHKPIFRRGITATDIRIDYDGYREFLIDSAVFPGSSGSPVCIYNKAPFKVEHTIHSDDRLLLIGVAYAVNLHTVAGDIIKKRPIKDIPLIALSSIPNHLGVVIKYGRIFDFKDMFRGQILV